VEIGGATIQWLSGHNANLIYENKIGPGARISIIRSGDVIPALHSVIQPCAEASMPAAGWSWDSTHVHAVASRGGSELAAKALHHAIETLGVEGIGPGLVGKAVEAGFTTLRLTLDADPAKLGAAIGAGRVGQFLPSLKKAVASANPYVLMIASNLLPKGVGERKLRPLFAICPDPRRWTLETFSKDGMCSGWTKESCKALIEALPPVLAWCSAINPDWCSGVVAAGASAVGAAPAPALQVQMQRKVAFTSVRPDSALQERMKAAGWVMEDLTKETILLVTADGAKETGKVTLAKKRGVEICTISEFRGRC